MLVYGHSLTPSRRTDSSVSMPAVQIVSDLHLEIDRGFGTQLYEFELTPTAPVLALLGDIGCTAHEGLGRWLEAQLRKYEAILFVLGNHGTNFSLWSAQS